MTKHDKRLVAESQKSRCAVVWLVGLLVAVATGYHFGDSWGAVGVFAALTCIDAGADFAAQQVIIDIIKLNE